VRRLPPVALLLFAACGPVARERQPVLGHDRAAEFVATDSSIPVAPPQPRSGALALVPLPAFARGAERRTLQRVAGDTSGNWLPVESYGRLRLAGVELLAGVVPFGRGSGYRATRYVLLSAGDTLGVHPIWSARAVEDWESGVRDAAPDFHFRGCLYLVDDSLLAYAYQSTARTPHEVLHDSLTPARGLYRLTPAGMRRLPGASPLWAQACNLSPDQLPPA
jgi:hypothetical protein